MRYAKIKNIDIENGIGIGTSLFVQGCDIHCKGCHNAETWNFEGGEEFTAEIESKWLEHISNYYVRRVSFLGGEPLAKQNIGEIKRLILKIRKLYPEKQIWLYTGRKYEEVDDKIKQICDYIVDGPFEIDKRDVSLAFRGSRNQRIIDCKTDKEIEYEEN